MRTALRAFGRSHHFAVSLLAVGALVVASVTFAAIVVGASATGISDHVTYTNLTLNTPSSVSAGDLMLASIAINGGSAVNVTSVPSGWTQVAQTQNDVNVTLVTYWKIAGASEPGSYLWTINAQTRAVGGITRYSGVDTTNPIDVSSGNTGFSASATTTAVTTSAANEEVLAVFATDVSKTLSTPTGLTQEYQQSHGNLGPTVAANDVLQVSAGSSGSNTSSIDLHASRYWAAQQIALRRLSGHPTINGSISTAHVGDVAVVSTTFSHTVNAGNNQMLIVTMGAEDGGGEDTSATYDGVAMTKGSAHGLGTTAYYDYWYLINPPQGTHDVVINFPSSILRQYAAITFDNVNQTTPLDTDGHTGALNNPNPAVSVTTTVPNEAILYFLDYDDTPAFVTYTPNDPALYHVSNNGVPSFKGNQGALHLQTAAGTVNVGGFISGDPSHSAWDLIAVPIRPAN